MRTNFNTKDFWDDNDESKKDFICKDASKEDIKKCEERLGFKLPDSYIALMEGHNGGILKRNVYQKRDAQGKIEKSVICEFLNAIGDEKHFSLLKDWSKWQTEGYNKGILIGLHMPDSGYAKRYYLDYSECGNQGEPRVICHTKIWRDNLARHVEFVLADTFEEFILGLVKSPRIPKFDFAFNTKEHRNSLVQEDLEDEEFYTYSTANWKYEGTILHNEMAKLSQRLSEYSGLLFTEGRLKDFRNKLIDHCVWCLNELKKDEYFQETAKDNMKLMVNVTTDDLSKSKIKKIISQLNG